MSQFKIKLLNGGSFDFQDMEQSNYTMDELAHNLARICRFNGSVNKHYSVAQHSVIVSQNVPEKYALAACVHDISEAVMGDMSSPLKALMGDFKRLEKDVEAFMFKRMGIPFPMHASIKLSDLEVLAAEIRDLQPHSADWSGVVGIDPYPKKIIPWSAEKSKREFLKRYEDLTKDKQ